METNNLYYDKTWHCNHPHCMLYKDTIYFSKLDIINENEKKYKKANSRLQLTEFYYHYLVQLKRYYRYKETALCC